jgi:hypothetical protein
MGLLEEQAREVLHIGPLIVTVLARRDETGVDFGQIRDPGLIFCKAPVRRGALRHGYRVA